jgi:predicted dienelactone hydrolase
LATTTSSVTLDDPDRPLMVDGTEVAATRSLPTTVVAPTRGRWPLVVFVHGYDVGPTTYTRFLDRLASEGYVVAAPSFPLEDPARGYPLTEADLPNEATDVSAVITELTGGSLRARLVPGAVGVVGHSDGADVALMIGYEPGLADARVRFVVAASPDPLGFAPRSGGPPLLLLHGSADQIVPPSSSDAVFDALSCVRYSLTFTGADHASAILGPSPWTAGFDTAVVDFASASLSGASSTELEAQLSAIEGTTLRSSAAP